MKNMIISLLIAASITVSTAAEAGRVTVTTADGVGISADHRGSGEHGVVLIHPFHSERGDWGDLAAVLDQQEINILSIDLRGHGASRGEATPAKMIADVAAATAYLRKRGAKKITLLGAGLGGNLAFAAAAQDPEITDVVMISPRLDAQGVKVSAALKGFGERPLLLLTGNDDQLSIKAANMMADRIHSASVEVLDADGSGLKLIHRDSSIQGILVSWLNGAYAIANGTTTLDTNTGSGAELETTGVKLGEK